MFFFANKKSNITIHNTGSIYYKKHTFLIKQIQKITEFANNSNNLINSETPVDCMELVTYGLELTLYFIIGNKNTGESSQIVVSNRSLSTEQALAENFQPLPKYGYKSIENLLVCAVTKALRNDLTTVGEINTKSLSSDKLDTMELSEVSGIELTNKLLTKNSYKELSTALDPDNQHSTEKLEVPNTRVLRSAFIPKGFKNKNEYELFKKIGAYLECWGEDCDEFKGHVKDEPEGPEKQETLRQYSFVESICGGETKGGSGSNNKSLILDKKDGCKVLKAENSVIKSHKSNKEDDLTSN